VYTTVGIVSSTDEDWLGIIKYIDTRKHVETIKIWRSNFHKGPIIKINFLP